MRRFYTHRYAERGGRGTRAPRVAAALPALPEATILTPLCGALAATRQYGTSEDDRERWASRYTAIRNLGWGEGGIGSNKKATIVRWRYCRSQ
jgi:hypothetical protein